MGNTTKPTRSAIAVCAGLLTVAAVLTAPALQGDDLPPHEQILRKLRNTSSVLPPPMKLAPVHTVRNREAIIPPQCYTRTEGTHNPCYVCHQNHIPDRENIMNDAHLQVAYSFSDVGLTNHWGNLFEDRRERVADISDPEILEWVDTDNYSELADRLRKVGFKGWIPDLNGLEEGAAAFDEHGFANDGSHWVAFNYKPFPSTFWPTNGSTDDVMIRLPETFRTDEAGAYSADVYRANLAIVEGRVKGLAEITSLPVDERAVGVDLDGDGNLGVTGRITQLSAYVGAAAPEFNDSFLYPEGTEFLHTVRYLGLDANDGITPSRRMKEVRYMKKWTAYRKSVYARHYQLEGFDKEQGNLPRYPNLGHYGLDNKNGWSLQSFIEDSAGRLRVATFEENMFCMGCHSSVGATIDKTYSFPRKVDGAAGWGYINLKGMPDAPTAGESDGEILTYFKRVGGGDEFRSNAEMQNRWFGPDGTLDEAAVRSAADVYTLITPSKARAMQLNKAYRTIVADQDYIYGRDSFVTAPHNVYDKVDNKTAPTLPAGKLFAWDIRLDWKD